MSEIKQISSFLLGDMKALYTVDEAGIAGFELLPICDLIFKQDEDNFSSSALPVTVPYSRKA